MNELTDERLAELRKVAEASQNLGAWKAYDGIDWNYRVMAGDKYLADTGEPGVTAHIAAFDPPTVLALLAEVERLRGLHKDRAALTRAVGAAQDAGDEAGVELTRSDLEPIVRAAFAAALGGEQR